MQRCNFVTLDVFEFLDRAKDEPGHGLYLGAPWRDDGGKYRLKFNDGQQRRLAARLAQFRFAKVVVRYGDHPLIRELYPESQWRWRELAGRTQANGTKREVVITSLEEVAGEVSQA